MLGLDVLVEVAVANKGELALVALEGPLPRVRVLVVLQVVNRIEPLLAHVALKGLLVLKMNPIACSSTRKRIKDLPTWRVVGKFRM